MFAHIPIIRDIIYGAVRHGASLEEPCSKLSISLQDLNDSSKDVDFEKAYKVWEHTVNMTKVVDQTISGTLKVFELLSGKKIYRERAIFTIRKPNSVQLAIRWLKNHSKKVEEIATLLGYSELSSFQRAFKSWSDTTPGKMRKSA